MSSDLTISDLRDSLPKKCRGGVSQQMVDDINNLSTDDLFRENYRENIIGFSSVLSEGRYKITSYMDAVRYTSFRMMGNNKGQSYRLTFPERYTKWIADGATAKTISAYAAAYAKGELVGKVEAQSRIPAHIYNADIFQAAINEQFSLMTNDDVSFKVRSDAADSLMKHLKPPEAQKIELEIDIKENTAIADLRTSARLLAEQQLASLNNGTATAQEIAHSDLVLEHNPE